MLGEVVGGNERQDVGAQGLGGFVVEYLGSGLLDGAVHALSLAIRPRAVGLGQPMLDAVLVAHAIEHVAHAVPLG